MLGTGGEELPFVLILTFAVCVLGSLEHFPDPGVNGDLERNCVSPVCAELASEPVPFPQVSGVLFSLGLRGKIGLGLLRLWVF